MWDKLKIHQGFGPDQENQTNDSIRYPWQVDQDLFHVAHHVSLKFREQYIGSSGDILLPSKPIGDFTVQGGKVTIGLGDSAGFSPFGATFEQVKMEIAFY